MDCNYEWFNFDGGECCDFKIIDVIQICFDFDFLYRVYLDVNELKNIFRLDGLIYFNIFFVNFLEEELVGVVIWLWDKEVLMYLGGIVLNLLFYGMFGYIYIMIYEIGYSLGFYYVF